MIAAGTLISVASAFGQAAGPEPGSKNIVPGWSTTIANEALRGAIHRALTSPGTGVYRQPMIARAMPLKPIDLMRQEPKVCAIPLLEALVKPTHDRIGAGRVPQVDPKMAVAAGVPPCPKR
jgi:hypothetical protein